MSRELYTKEFLISELQRFKKENRRNPKAINMQIKFGYPSYVTYQKRFGSWNSALLAAGLEVNQYQDHWQDGTETCDNCGKVKSENQGWYYKNKKRICYSCYMNRDYKNGKLDVDSPTGFAFMSQRVVAETLGLELKYDCNCSIGFNAPDDLYDEKLGYINVKTAVLLKVNAWHFGLIQKYTPDTYIMLGFSNDKSDILHVWITEPEDDLTFDEKKIEYKKGIKITNDIFSDKRSGLKRAESWEVDVKPYNYVYHNMSLENCSVLRND